MNWVDRDLDALGDGSSWGDRVAGPSRAEPTALVALAMSAWGRAAAARRALQWLAGRQSEDGGVWACELRAGPAWTTALAVLAWSGAAADRDAFDGPIEAGVRWLLGATGEVMPRAPELGHDTTLVGWPWVLGSHSWVEPTAWSLLALKAAGRRDHERAKAAARLLIDRLLPGGGCNYGNTTLLGRELRPQIEPTGLAMLALGGAPEAVGPAARSLDYLAREVSGQTPVVSLCYGLIGLAAHGRTPTPAADWLAAAFERTTRRDAAPATLALLALAAAGLHGRHIGQPPLKEYPS